ncbi:protein kinase domain-containing protein [Nonomuraea insulae]|uniref:non-specific serine/threonine protein kinase n=1 Tax=Nonomuraea insulae TaxID=1616787 RepID=A0ABW1CRB5_9ACTN
MRPIWSGSRLERLAITTLSALEVIHQAGVIHRDFKPSNVIMSPEGPVVIDFGIARVLEQTTSHSGPVGTLAYMAPEQFNGQAAGTTSDVFSWAATMVYAATGHPAFPGSTTAAVVGAIVTREPDLSGVPDALGSLLSACLAKDPADRPAIHGMPAGFTRVRAQPGSRHDRPAPPPAPETTHGEEDPEQLPAPAGSPRRRTSRRRRPAAVAGVVAVAVSLSVWLWGPPETWPSFIPSPAAEPFGTLVDEPFSAGDRWIDALAVAQLGDRPVVVSADGAGTVRVWSLGPA